MTTKDYSRELSCSFAPAPAISGAGGSPDCSAGSPPPCASSALCSHALCEICGIEGKWIEYTTETTDGCVNSGKKRVFPDFNQPENFVKLEELMLAELAKQRLTVVKWVHYFSDNTLMHEYILITKCGHKFKFKHNDIAIDNWFVERENRTECLILFILWKVLPLCGDSLKQAIREQEWSYV